MNPMLLSDFYKLSHRLQYPQGTEYIYSTWTPRDSKVNGVNKVIAFGFQAFVKTYLIDYFNNNFFNKPLEQITREYKRVLKYTLGVDDADVSHIVELHNLGYLPLRIDAVQEGTAVPVKVPMLTIQNTHPKFFWLTNYIETLASSELWKPCTSATLANEYRKLMNSYAMETVGNTDFVQFQGHDFSMRGMSSLESATLSGMAHLTSFVGTDTVPAILAAETLYNTDLAKELVGTSIPATEHSIQCTYGNDKTYLSRMINEVHPSGFVSIVSDGYDYWNVLTEVLPSLKSDIMNRQGKVVIRPDSGDPVKIVCGNPEGATEAEKKGSIEVLWDIFGGTVNSKGYKVLDEHIGLIYGDSITLERAKAILEGLKQKGFASTNVVFGIGSYTYQYNTRDTFGFALKSTSCIINGDEKQIFKNPKTDNGIKKSQKGRVAVVQDGNNLKLIDNLSLSDNVDNNMLRPIFLNGQIWNQTSLSEIRNKVRESL